MGSDSSFMFVRSFLGLLEQTQSITCFTSNTARFALPVFLLHILQTHTIMSYVMPPTAHSPHEVGYSREDTKSSTSQER